MLCISFYSLFSLFRVPGLVESEIPFVGLGRAGLGLGRARGDSSAVSAGVLQKAPVEPPRSEISSEVSNKLVEKK